ncbi:MAG: response regulator [Synergistaceae bacterium]|nr:response regulator [Synergistaceae bacterium]
MNDDITNLLMAGNVMSKSGMRVTVLKSGKALLEYIETIEPNEVPDLCLLDIKIPDMNGFETLKALRASKKGSELSIIFLTADESEKSETVGLSLGAMDFIKKPFVPEVLVLRAKHIIDLVRLQRNLSHEVEAKTEEKQKLFVHVMSVLAAAIDAKDIYTNGHSGRVAKYAGEIAKSYGYSEQKQNDMYTVGLLHDVGKVGIPDSIMQKSDNLTDEGIEKVKEHTVIGARILSSSNEMPLLAFAAKYHHERYDGSGYPKGLSGQNIPEQARIIAVANAYNTMLHRDKLSHDDIKLEIEKGSGSLFDPKFADIMLKMIDEDPNL